ncbi:acetyl-CoA synthetase-like protein [Aaosphaeria arxii CBS 175.79]|uniref:Acetyl-CoA synthetase-like protein n=1 Tax=Aaosphaeria arxii CBS 175.79 TaxID=1450172 RepID=A0A6A5XQQ5_9PLEO|nr:acetyl-CoA synthetase-like protein [Aaosphaeria arxii CBS 175.79]KAF2015070.1 acetyl-CoA synthetase-like protein [Aaosphaeria arxii CBS 175.79]
MMSKSHVDSVSSTIANAISTVLGLEPSEINFVAPNSTFVKLGGDSLTAILIAAECQKNGISISASVFLRASSLEESIAKAEISAQLLDIDLNTPFTPTPNSLLPSQGLPPCSTAFSSHSSTDCDGLSSLSSSYDHIATSDLQASNTLSSYNEQKIMTATDLLGRINATEWTEMQLLLLRETSIDQKRNIVTVHDLYTGESDPQHVCNIWMNTIWAEPIFQDFVTELCIPPHQLLLQKIIHVESEDGFQEELRNAFLVDSALSKLTVVRLNLSSVAVVWRVHHSFIDGFSARLLHDKIRRNLLSGRVSVSPGPSFKETVRALGRLREERREATRRFWENERAKFPSAVGELCLNPQRDQDESTSQGVINLIIPEAQLAAARARTGLTSTIYFAAAWALTLGKFMDTDQVCFGMTFSGRDLPILGAFDVVGPLINILPLSVQMPVEGERETSVRAFLLGIQDRILELNDIQYSDTTDGFDRKFTSIMATQFEELEGSDEFPIGVSGRPDVQSGIALNLIIHGQNCLRVLYSTSKYSEEDMHNVWSVFQNAMSCFLQDDDEQPLASAMRQGLMPLKMEQTIRRWSNCESLEALDESKGDDLVTLFESVVARQPTAVAVTRGQGQDISYDEFDQCSSVVARELTWVKLNEPVCVYADRSVDWLVAILGVLKAGGVYTPLDPSAPASVRHANFVQSGARAIIFPSKACISPDVLPVGCRTLFVDTALEKNRIESRQDRLTPSPPRRRIARPDDLAYICFTSGSTGQPKAVQCTHKALVAFQRDYIVRLCARKGTVVAQVMSPVFDGSIHEIFSTLTYGATLRLGSIDAQDNPFAHLQDCDSAIFTPSIASALDANQYPRLRNVYLVGEAVPQSVSDAWTKDHTVYNMYGPTEATCGATIKQLATSRAVTLGQANPSSRVYILDRNQWLLPPGAVGEMYLAGIQVSEGYINLPLENASRFFYDSVLPEAEQKMYKTGDFAYWDSMTGEICIIGRKDRQIKLRGFRLDLDDLEAQITNAIPSCRGAAVFRREDYLVAAYAMSPTSIYVYNESEVKTLIRDAIPPYANPRRILPFRELPLTKGGKLDYKKLEEIDKSNALKPQPLQKSITGTELMIVRAVRDLMKLDPSIPIDRDSDLLALGAHSIVQLQLASRLSSLIQRKFTVKHVFDNPVISHLASSVDEVVKGQVVVDQDGWEKPACFGRSKAASTFEVNDVSPIESVWFAKYQQNLGTSAFNVSHVSKLDDEFDQHDALVSAWTAVLKRHAILRCRFRPSMAAHEGVERFYAAQPPKALYVDSFDVRVAINSEFSLDSEHPIRVIISKSHMLVCLSHIICDYSTLNRLLEEFLAAYYHEDGAGALLLASQKCYQDTMWGNVAIDLNTARFWRSYLSEIDYSRLPPYMKKARASYHGASRMFQLSNNSAHNLETVSRSLHLTKHQIALAIVSLILQTDSSTKQDLILGGPYIGRQEGDMSTIGLFLQPLPIRVSRQSKLGEALGDAPVRNFLLTVQDSARSALSHGIEWASLLHLLSLSDDNNLRSATTTPSPNHPLVDAMVTFHERSVTGKASLLTDGVIAGVEPLVTWAEGAKFGIMFEFSAVRSSVLTLRIEYDTLVFSADEVMAMTTRINTALEGLCESIASSTKVRDLEDRLLHASDLVHNRNEIKGVKFGSPLASLS